MGICSTTYGDLVCRGCKRFAHEIVMWNGFEDRQRVLVCERLDNLREGAVRNHLDVTDAGKLNAAAAELHVPDAATLNQGMLVLAVLRRGARSSMSPVQMGITAVAGMSAARLLEVIEAEFYARSVAQYEHSFHTLAQ